MRSFFHKVIHTFGTSLFSIAIQVVLLLVSTQMLGKEGRGIVSLFVLNITVLAQISGFVGGHALVFMASKSKLKNLLLPSYIWTGFSLFLGYGILSYTNQLQAVYVLPFFISGLLQCLLHSHQQILLGYNRVKAFNYTQVIFSVAWILAVGCIFYEYQVSAKGFVYAYIIGQFFAFLFSTFKVLKYRWNEGKDSKSYKMLLKYGVIIQVGNTAQTLNNRFSYYLLNHSFASGTAMVGLFSTAMMIIEKINIIARSISTVQYAEISGNSEKANLITPLGIKLVTWVTLFLLVILLLIPESVYLYFVGSQFEGIKTPMLILAPGIWLLSISNILSHHFSGLGKYHYNAYASLGGMLITVMAGVMLIPKYGINMAAIVTTLSYSVLTLIQLIIFYKKVPFSFSHWIVRKKDLMALIAFLDARKKG